MIDLKLLQKGVQVDILKDQKTNETNDHETKRHLSFVRAQLS